jgi:enoyl-CoA hydratase/carnithine racemase
MGSAIERTVEYMKSALAGIKVLEVAEAWNEVWEDRDVRVVILTGAGDRHFGAGHNLAP